jgi:predicted TIM-barrel fold metal-dependent hydrolase
MITDAQIHIFDADRPEKPWPRHAWRPKPSQPHFTAEEIVAALDAHGVGRAVLAPPAWIGDEPDTGIEAAERYPGRFAVIGEFDPLRRGAEAKLESLWPRKHLVGLRLVFLRGDGDTAILLKQALEDDSLDWFWRVAEERDIPVMCFTQEKVALLGKVAARHPGLTLIIDHLASVAAPTPAESFVAIDDLVALAKYPNVVVKVSDAPNRSKQPYPYADVQPFVRKIYDAYGPRRMIWGSDITQLHGLAYADVLRFWQEGLPFLSDDDRRLILGGTVAEVLRWPEG